MSTASARIGDLVLVDKKGRRFHAELTAKEDGVWTVRPISPNISYRTATTREIVKLWRAPRRRG